MDAEELREVRRAAKSAGLTVSAWVRQALHAAAAASPRSRTKDKLEIIRSAFQYDFPAPDIEAMNAEIASGYATGWEP